MIMAIMRRPISTARDSINRYALCGGIKGLKNKNKSLMQGKSIKTLKQDQDYSSGLLTRCSTTSRMLQQWPADQVQHYLTHVLQATDKYHKYWPPHWEEKRWKKKLLGRKEKRLTVLASKNSWNTWRGLLSSSSRIEHRISAIL